MFDETNNAGFSATAYPACLKKKIKKSHIWAERRVIIVADIFYSCSFIVKSACLWKNLVHIKKLKSHTFSGMFTSGSMFNI